MKYDIINCGSSESFQGQIFDKPTSSAIPCPLFPRNPRFQPLVVTQDANLTTISCPNTNCATHQGHPSKQKNG